jgi:hypothetical protein
MAKIAKIYQPTPLSGKLYALIPIGLYFNKTIQKAKPGDTVEFQDAWHRDKFELVRKSVVEIKTSVFNFMCCSLYGSECNIPRILARWRALAEAQGCGKKGLDEEQALLIEVKPIVEKTRMEKRKELVKQQYAIQADSNTGASTLEK